MGDMKTCRICSRPSGGIRFGVLCCRGCKEFYRRSTESGRVFKCYLGGTCSSDYEAALKQRNCKACRYRKCIEMGMNGSDRSGIISISNRSTDFQVIPEDSQSKNDQPKTASTEATCEQFQDGNRSSGSSPGLCTSTDESPDDSPDSRRDPEHSDRRIVRSHTEHSRNMNITTQLEHFLDEHGVKFSPILDLRFGFSPVNSYEPETGDFFRLLTQCRRNTVEHQRLLVQTITDVERAVQLVFGRQLAAWTQFKNSFIRKHGAKPARNPDISSRALDDMVAVVNRHNLDHSRRVINFARQLPGMDKMGYVARRFYPATWKWIVFGMIHDAPFNGEEENYVILGENNLHYSRFWEERLIDENLCLFGRQFTRELRELKLTQTESYLLMAVVMFEPGEIVVIDILSNDEHDFFNSYSNAVHRHYADALLYSIKQRSYTFNQFVEICRKLGVFFNRLKLASVVHTRFFSFPNGNWPVVFQLVKDMASSEFSTVSKGLRID